MAITSPSAGVTIDTPAKDNGVLQQASGLPDNQFVLPDSINATNNGNLGFSTINGRLIVVRPREPLEETRYILAEDGGTTGTVTEDFDSPPTGGTAYWIAYVIEDAATVVGMSLISKRQRDYDMGKPLLVSDGTADAYFAILDGASLASDNRPGVGESNFHVQNLGRWDIGYEEGGAPIPGGYLVSTGEDPGDWALEVDAGGQIKFYEMFLTSVERNVGQMLTGSSVHIDGFQIYKELYETIFQGTGTYRNLILQGTSVPVETVKVSQGIDVRGVLGINFGGFVSDDPGPIDIYDYQSVGMLYDVEVSANNQEWRFLNPIWGAATQEPLIGWTGTAVGQVDERYEFTLDASDPAGFALEGGIIYAYDDWLADPANQYFQIITGSTDALGNFYSNLVQREWVNNPGGGSGSTHGPFDLRVLLFGKSPFESAFSLGITGTAQGAYEVGVTLVDDGGVELSEGGADGVSYAVYEHGTGTAPGNLIAFNNGTIAFVEGDIVVGVSSGATGTVADISGDTSAGTLFIKNRNGSAFTDGEDLQVGGVKNAEADYLMSGSFLNYSWEWWADTEALDDSYSAQSSRTAKASPDAWVLSMLKHRTQLFQRSGGDFWTEDVDSEGVYISERGAGNILYLTADNGWQWTPPQQFTLTLTGIVTGSGGSEVRIYERIGVNDTGTELAGTETADVTFQYSYEHGGSDIPTIIVVFHEDYDPIWQHYDLTAADASLPIQQTFDRVYSNP